MITRKSIRRLPYVAGVTLLSAMVSAAGAKADTIDFNFTGSIVSFTAPVTGVYDIDAFGAEGGVNTGVVVKTAGLGAEAGGQFSLTAGQTLSILVGGQGGNGRGLDGGGGGGGGTFVAIANMPSIGPACPGASFLFTCPDTLLVAAGGGGGAGTLRGGFDGQSGTSGTLANFIGGAAGGPGFGAEAGVDGGGGGGGYVGNAFGCEVGAGCGQAFVNGGAGGGGEVLDSIFGLISAGGNGGFGSGGGGGQGGAGGGGGGFGGGAGADQGSGGGGGGSFVNDALLLTGEVLASGARSGAGEVIITFQSSVAAVPEPASLALLGTGLIALGVLRRRWKKA